MCLPVAGEAAPPPGVEVRNLPVAGMAVAHHRGPHKNVESLCAGLFNWMEAEEHRPAGPLREVYLVARPRAGSAEEFATEVQALAVQAGAAGAAAHPGGG